MDGTIHDSSNEYDPLPRNTFVSTDRHRKLSAEGLAENWGIGIRKAKVTIDATTQKFRRSAINCQ